MRTTPGAAALLGAICLSSLVCPVTFGQAPAPAPATRPAGQQDVPVRAVVLFSSGVGYFEHFGSVAGTGSTELRFKTEQINDVLKSLVLQDLDGGTAGTVSYPSQEPLARTLKSFQVDVTNNPSLPDLLNQLRGARLKVTSGGEPFSGIILGVEKRVVPAPKGQGGGEGRVIEQHHLNLKTGRKVRVIPIEGVDDFELEDPKLDAELDRALEALSQARDQDKKPVTINFRGEGNRRVRVGYVVETPIWKSSYRLILSGAQEGANAQGEEPGRAAPIGPARPGSAPRADDGQGATTLQGWAIVENQTDADWTDVQLSLVSGRPISFIQDLYNPLYVPRPVVKPELYASLRPQTYEGGVTPEALERLEERRAGAEDMAAEAAPQGGSGAGLFAASGDRKDRDGDGPIDAAASVRALASGSRVGELFQYTVGNVSIPRQKSAMIPIVSGAVEAEKLVVFNFDVLERHPLNGVRLKNTTGNHLLQGPVTVLEAGTYAGDARIENLPPGQERLLTYGVDLQTEMDVTNTGSPGVVETGKIVKGVLQVRRSRVSEWKYVAENKSAAEKTLVIEHARPHEAELVEPAKADELTDAVYRFRRVIAPGKPATFALRLRTADVEHVQLLKSDADAIGVYVRAAQVPEAVRKALDDVVRLKDAVADTTRQVEERRKSLADVTAEQSRIRENLKTVAESTEYYTRLLKKLDEQETTIEKLQGESAALQKQLEERRAELEKHVRELNVG